MNKTLIPAILLCAGLVSVPLVFAQSAETTSTEKSSTQTDAVKTSDGSHEVEYNDDNYRRFMELKDQPTQSSSLPTNAFNPGKQKLDELPEASQKHLRNQLRQIIMEAGEWAPGDENNKYPYVASEAAQKDPDLKQQEAEAWGELVGKYQEREAQIYANSSRPKFATGGKAGAQAVSQAQAQAQANGAESAAASDTGADADSGKKGDGQEQQQPGEGKQSASSASKDAYSPSSSSTAANPDDPDSASQSGVSQSALQYLMSNREAGSSKTAGDNQSAQNQSDQSQSAQNQSDQSQSAQNQSDQSQSVQNQSDQSQSVQNQSDQSQSAQNQSDQSQSAQNQSDQSQSAQNQSDQSQNQSDQSQSAAVQQPGQPVVFSSDTLSVKDLQNAQGISISTGAGTTPATVIMREKDNSDSLRKDEDG